MKKLIVMTGAGISAESGLKTFRDNGGLWEGHNIEDVATPNGWQSNPSLVLDFYNERRRQLQNASPNRAHLDLAEFEKLWDVHIITQNVDDLHERAGSKKVLHLHGELLSVRSSLDEELRYHWTRDLKIGDLAEDGSQLRPDIVWFGEAVPNLILAEELCRQADAMLVVGTSLQVYPAAGLIFSAPKESIMLYVDPHAEQNMLKMNSREFQFFNVPATEGVKQALEYLLK